MVAKKKSVKKIVKTVKKVKAPVEQEDEESESLDVDDALAGLDEGDVASAPSKPRKLTSKKSMDHDLDDVEEEITSLSKNLNGNDDGPVSIKASKPISKVKKGDTVTIDGDQYKVDGHYVLIDHGSTKEITIELFDTNDKDYQLRYFDDQVENTLQFYELQEIVYVRKPLHTVSW